MASSPGGARSALLLPLALALALLAAPASSDQAAAPAAAAPAETPAQEAFEAGKKAFFSGDGAAAIEAFQKATELDPKMGKAYVNMGIILQNSDKNKAIEMFQKAIEVQPGLSGGYMNLGIVLLSANLVDDAVGVLQKAVDVDPGHGTSWYNLALGLKAQQKHQESLEAFMQTVSLGGGSARDAYHNIGVMLNSFTVDLGAAARSTRVEVPPLLGAGAPESPDDDAAFLRAAQNVSMDTIVQWRAAQGQCIPELVSKWEDHIDHVMIHHLTGPDFGDWGEEYGSVRPNVTAKSTRDLPNYPMAPGPKKSQRYNEQSAYLAVFNDVAIAGQGAMLYDYPNGCKIFLMSHGSFTPLSDAATFLAPAKPPGGAMLKVASVMQHGTHNFYHLMLEVMPRLAMLLPELSKDPEIALLVPGDERVRVVVDVLLEILGPQLGIKRAGFEEGTRNAKWSGRQVLYYSPRHQLVAREMFTVDWRPSGPRRGMYCCAPRAAIRAARDALIRGVGEAAGVGPRKLVYASRGDVASERGRQLENEEGLVTALEIAAEKLGLEFVLFKGSEVPVYRAIEVFQGAQVVVGAHGAALSNMIFMKGEQSAVVEVAMVEAGHRHYMHAAAALDLGYWMVTGAPPNSFDQDFAAPIDRVLEAVYEAAKYPEHHVLGKDEL